MTPPEATIDGKYRLVVANNCGIDHLLDLIVEQKGLAAVVDDENGMADLQVQVLDRNHPQFIVSETQVAQRQVLDDRIIFAITEPGDEFSRRLPIVFFPPILGIGDVVALVGPVVDVFDEDVLGFAAQAVEKFFPQVIVAGIEFLRITVLALFFLGLFGAERSGLADRGPSGRPGAALCA